MSAVKNSCYKKYQVRHAACRDEETTTGAASRRAHRYRHTSRRLIDTCALELTQQPLSD